MRNLLLTGGINHPFADAARAVADLLEEVDFATRIEDDIEAGLARLADAPVDLVTVHALRWRMLVGDKYAPYRGQWAFSLSPAGQRALTDHLSRGGGLIALHTAVICFDDWPGWRELVGGVWRWNVSSHPPLGPVSVRIAPSTHPIVAGSSDFATVDEVYSDLDLAEDVVPLAYADAGAGYRPVIWARDLGRGRVVTDLLGHDRAAIEQPAHAALLRRAAEWSCAPR